MTSVITTPHRRRVFGDLTNQQTPTSNKRPRLAKTPGRSTQPVTPSKVKQLFCPASPRTPSSASFMHRSSSFTLPSPSHGYQPVSLFQTSNFRRTASSSQLGEVQQPAVLTDEDSEEEIDYITRVDAAPPSTAPVVSDYWGKQAQLTPTLAQLHTSIAPTQLSPPVPESHGMAIVPDLPDDDWNEFML
eukprot:TRINITY_DN3992_c0_g1_i1.p1 TRINITY_DN3992_c0_g1~~TRINITY_DN3992_c0_g1_i1.p1  ORF type:complete len:188 (+),score=7.09 TRINITY_DN3992_c0_g1_i1:58-621(+)